MVRKLAVALLVLSVLPLNIYASPKIQHWNLKNGARVYFVQSKQLPIVQINLAFDAGSARDSTNRYGLALLANHLLKEGTVGKSAGDVARIFENVGAEFSTNVDRDMATMSLRSLSYSEKLQPAVKLFSELVLNPAMPEAGLTRERERLLVGLQRKRQSPGDQASELFFNLVYGNHPYAHESEGSEKHIARISRKDLLSFHKKYYVGSNAVVAIMGDLSTREAKKLAKQVVGGLPIGQRPARLPEIPGGTKAVTRMKKFPSTQSHVLVGQVGVHRKDPDYFSLYLGNYILGGGGLVSRLSEEIREKHGLSYSVYSYFWPLNRRGPFIIGLQTENKHRDKALRLVNEVLTNFIEKGPTAEELEAAKSHITGGFALRIDTSKKIASYLTVIGFYNLPLNYLDEFPRRIESLTVEKIQDAFKRRIKPAAMTTVVVGGQ